MTSWDTDRERWVRLSRRAFVGASAAFLTVPQAARAMRDIARGQPQCPHLLAIVDGSFSAWDRFSRLMQNRGIATHSFTGANVCPLWFGSLEPALSAQPSLGIVGWTTPDSYRCLEVMARDYRRATLARVDCRDDTNIVKYRLWMSRVLGERLALLLSAGADMTDMLGALTELASEPFGAARVLCEIPGNHRSGASARGSVGWIMTPCLQ